MKGKTLLTKTSGSKILEENETDVRTSRDKRTSKVRHKMEAASRKVRYAGKHIDINDNED